MIFAKFEATRWTGHQLSQPWYLNVFCFKAFFADLKHLVFLEGEDVAWHCLSAFCWSFLTSSPDDVLNAVGALHKVPARWKLELAPRAIQAISRCRDCLCECRQMLRPLVELKVLVVLSLPRRKSLLHGCASCLNTWRLEKWRVGPMLHEVMVLLKTWLINRRRRAHACWTGNRSEAQKMTVGSSRRCVQPSWSSPGRTWLLVNAHCQSKYVLVKLEICSYVFLCFEINYNQNYLII